MAERQEETKDSKERSMNGTHKMRVVLLILE